MKPVIALIAVVDLVDKRDGAVCCHGQSEDELFQIGPMIFVVPVSEEFARPPAVVAPLESDRRRVLVNLLAVELKNP